MPNVNVRTADALNSLLRGELAAVETYEQGMRKAIAEETILRGLSSLRDRHVEAADLLRRVLELQDEPPATSSGAWGAFAQAVEGAATLLGNAAAMKVLREGEEHGTKEYRRILDFEDLDPRARVVLGQLHREQKKNPAEVERLLQVA